MKGKSYTTRRRPSWGVSLPALAVMVGLTGCDSLLQVSNPNNIAGDDVLLPAAAAGLANGALSGVARGFAGGLTAYSTVTDELDWVGSRDDYGNHDRGFLDDPFNEFTDAEFPLLATGRWQADEAIRIIGGHIAAGEASVDAIDLARSHLYRAIIYVTIADMYDDFVFSDRSVSASPIGPANMGGLYSDAITSATTARDMAIAEGDGDLEEAARAMLAVASHRQSIWTMLNPVSLSNNGLVTNATARDLAVAALAAMSDPDYRLELEYTSSTISARIGSWVNNRQEMKIGPTYATPDPTDFVKWTGVSLEDLIDVGTVSPELERIILAFDGADIYPTLTVTSAREMHLIIAEHALATGDMGGFAAAINDLRGLDAGLADWDQAAPQVPALDLLRHSRQTNLFFYGVRLGDLYRWGQRSAEWIDGAPAVTNPGTFFPIVVKECQANENIPDSCR